MRNPSSFIPSVFDRPVMGRPTRPYPFGTPANSLSTELRLVLEDFRRTAALYKETVVFSSDGAAHWPAPSGSDVFLALELNKANRLLDNGPRTYSYACAVADKLAFAITARQHGLERVSNAPRSRRPDSRRSTNTSPLKAPHPTRCPRNTAPDGRIVTQGAVVTSTT